MKVNGGFCLGNFLNWCSNYMFYAELLSIIFYHRDFSAWRLKKMMLVRIIVAICPHFLRSFQHTTREKILETFPFPEKSKNLSSFVVLEFFSSIFHRRNKKISWSGIFSCLKSRNSFHEITYNIRCLGVYLAIARNKASISFVKWNEKFILTATSRRY